MKKTVFMSVLLVVLASFTYAQTQDSIIFTSTTYDYGVIEQGGDGLCEFTFTNKGEKPLILSNVRAACGCTVPEWPREPIMPGESNSIKIKYNTNIIGTFSKTIQVYSNAVNSHVVLTITGQVNKQE
ncbi:MAG: DUF1573 domain-containing protein [Bacteroidales bacterium]|jgi:hypothetical protein|nr:DUF1573 domain-containing protein [Bacteroidales bacterium]HPY82074.1 DUF1573 domain-containing protein [Bacteroidales bacterium]